MKKLLSILALTLVLVACEKEQGVVKDTSKVSVPEQMALVQQTQDVRESLIKLIMI